MRTLLIVAAVALFAPAAWAHAMLDKASPAVGSQVPQSPPALTLTYSEAVEPYFCHVTVTDAAGTQVSDGKPAAQQDGRVLVIKLKPLAPGTYNVAWQVTSVDTHKTEGHFSFTVKP
jgi:copper resistance protein C